MSTSVFTVDCLLLIYYFYLGSPTPKSADLTVLFYKSSGIVLLVNWPLFIFVISKSHGLLTGFSLISFTLL